MAPELLLKKGHNGKKVDIWACGVLLFYMLTGVFPFLGKTEKELANNVINVNYNENELPNQTSKELIREVFLYDPIRRPTSDKILMHKFFNE